MPKKLLQNGFTLIEILVVVAIIAILSLIAFASYSNVHKNTNDAKKKADIEEIAKIFEQNYDGVANVYKPLQDSNFSTGKIPTPPEGGSYSGLVSADSSGFNVCAALAANPTPTCSESSTTCYCIKAKQGETASSSPAPGGGLIGGPAPAGLGFYRAFATSTQYNGDLKTAGSAVGLGVAADGIDGANKICQSRANAAQLGGNWKAWISVGNGGVTAAQNLSNHPTIPIKGYYLFNGDGAQTWYTVADSWNHLVTAESGVGVGRYDESGHQITGSDYVWTNTAHDGTNISAQDCSQWTSVDDGLSFFGFVGKDNGNVANGWTNLNSSQYCTSSAHLYCFEQ